jgi:dUTP pyrophosphatase
VKNFIDVGAGVVDADYRGPVGVVLFNHGEVDFEVLPGDRVAQLILEKVHLDVTVTEIAELPETVRRAPGSPRPLAPTGRHARPA